jgi:hypothetical protein
MTYHTHKEKQSGVTMLLAIFILTGMVSIAAIVGPLINAEISQSYSSYVAEQMFFQSRGQSEFSLFFLKRDRADLATIPACSASGTGTASFGGSVGSTIINCQSEVYPNPLTFTLPAGTERYFYLFDPNNPDDESANGAKTMYVSNMFGGEIGTGLCNFDQDGCEVDSNVLSSGDPARQYSGLDSAGTRRQLHVVNSSSSLATVQVVIVCEAGRDSCSFPSGETILNTSSTFNGVTRRLKTIVP